MKISNILIASTIVLFTACNSGENTKHGHPHGKEEHQEHGHEHSDEHGHNHDDAEHHEQEEFTISNDSIQIEAPEHSHPHNDGNEHHSH